MGLNLHIDDSKISKKEEEIIQNAVFELQQLDKEVGETEKNEDVFDAIKDNKILIKKFEKALERHRKKIRLIKNSQARKEANKIPDYFEKAVKNLKTEIGKVEKTINKQKKRLGI